MEGRIKYLPSKTQLSMFEMRQICEKLKRENEKLKAELRKAQEDSKWALWRLQDAQEQNRQLGITITYLIERSSGNVETNPG